MKEHVFQIETGILPYTFTLYEIVDNQKWIILGNVTMDIISRRIEAATTNLCRWMAAEKRSIFLSENDLLDFENWLADEGFIKTTSEYTKGPNTYQAIWENDQQSIRIMQSNTRRYEAWRTQR